MTVGILNFAYYFAPYYLIWKQNHPLNWVVTDVFLTRCFPIAFTLKTMFANCVLDQNDNGRNVHVSEREILFIPNCGRFAVEFD